jgi:hypothetical protein
MDFCMLLFFTCDCRLLFQGELLKGGGTGCLSNVITEDNLKHTTKVCILLYQICIFQCLSLTVVFFQILVPIVDDGHISLVAVSIEKKTTYVLDSTPGRHQKQAHTVLKGLELYLSECGIDISSYDHEIPNVQPQKNK